MSLWLQVHGIKDRQCPFLRPHPYAPPPRLSPSIKSAHPPLQGHLRTPPAHTADARSPHSAGICSADFPAPARISLGQTRAVGPKGGPGAHLGPAWPAEMGSVSSALARSRNAAVQPGSPPPPARKAVRPAPPAPRRDPEAPAVIARNPRLAPGREETPVAWAQPGSPELSAVLNCTQDMSKPYKPRSRSAAGKSHSLREVRGARVLAKLPPPAPLLNFSNKFPFFPGSLSSLGKKRGGGYIYIPFHVKESPGEGGAQLPERACRPHLFACLSPAFCRALWESRAGSQRETSFPRLPGTLGKSRTVLLVHTSVGRKGIRI